MNEIMQQQLSIFYNLWRESMLMYEEWSKQRGLSYNCVMVLYSLCEDKDCTQKKIAQKWLLPKQTINTVLKDFKRRGLILLSPLPSDKRNKLIRLTPEGKKYAFGIISELRSLELFVMSHLGLQRVARMNADFKEFVTLFREKGAV